MKKLVLFFAAMFVTIFVMAQNTADVTQTGNDQNTVVTQTGADQHATVTQDGNLNKTIVDQLAEASSYGPGKQTATVTQDGTSNLASIDQNQTGGGDKAENTALIDQIGTNNKAYQTENAPGSNSGQHLTAIQNGTENLSHQLINGGYTDYFWVDQKGKYNVATQTGTGITTNTARIYQDGLRNNAVQTLKGSNNGYYGGFFYNEKVKIDQTGNDNSAKQIFSGYGSNHGNSAYIGQTGNNNMATETGDGRNVYADIIQNGYRNTATTKQTGSKHQIFLNQIGNDNTVRVTQDNDRTGDPLGNYADIDIEGNFNNGVVSSIGYENTVDVDVMGNLNRFTVLQTGTGHSATIMQTGNSNVANITQNLNVN